MTIEGQAGRSYQLDGLPPIAVVRSGERGLLIGTSGAVSAALRAVADKHSLADLGAASPLVSRLTPTTSKVLWVNVGPSMELFAGMSRGPDAQQLQAIGGLVRDMKVLVMTDEAPNQLTVDVEVEGLPKFRDIVPLFRPGGPRRGVAAK